ncbi:DUF3087 domain-containing protein [Thalassotalea sp. PLHSN55]|uniref:DUF3087 domain-containing protein n=1 Tax=Thalassotalea sp. PLHSN55 TaxID=3435888 RepID=UPI003F865D69
MNLIEIDKTTYRKNLNKVIVAFVASFAILAVLLGTVLIHFFGDVAVAGETVNNFRFNLLGVIIALVMCTLVLNKLKDSDLFKEIYYVWQLKQLHNQIYRRLTKIKAAAQKGEIDAFIVLNFYYTSLKQVYELDDNTLTITKVDKDLQALEEQYQALNLTVTLAQFEPTLIKSIS